MKKKKDFIINTIKNDSKNSKKVQQIINLVKDNKGLEFAEKMIDLYNEAIELISDFEENDTSNH